jgi:hypothetical protein
MAKLTHQRVDGQRVRASARRVAELTVAAREESVRAERDTLVTSGQREPQHLL